MQRNSSITAIAQVYQYIRAHGPIETTRVSSAQAHGRAKQYAYWGVATYQIRLNSAGMPTHAMREGARSDRRSERLAHLDAIDYARRTGRTHVQWLAIGQISERNAARLIAEVL
jgi:hypothetical protein